MALGDHKAMPWIITDFETGGLDLSKFAITEIAMIAIKGDTLEEIDRYESLVKPYGMQYDPKAFEKTGLSEAKLQKEGKPFNEVVQDTIDFLIRVNIHKSKTQHKPTLVAHNAPFEVQCFQQMFVKRDKELQSLVQGMTDYYGHFVPAYLDTMRISQMLWAANPRIKTFSLETTCERASIQISDGHRAMNDVIPTLEFLRQGIKMLRASDSGRSMEITGDDVSFRSNFRFQIS